MAAFDLEHCSCQSCGIIPGNSADVKEVSNDPVGATTEAHRQSPLRCSLRHNAEIDLKSVQLHSLKWVEVLVVLLQGRGSCEHPGVTALLAEAACGQAG